MTIEELVRQALGDLAAGRIFPDFAPTDTDLPFITYQAVGGQPINFLTGEKPGLTNVRVQINVWSESRIEASSLGAAVESAMREAVALKPEVVTGRASTLDDVTQYRGTMQDFSLHY